MEEFIAAEMEIGEEKWVLGTAYMNKFRKENPNAMEEFT